MYVPRNGGCKPARHVVYNVHGTSRPAFGYGPTSARVLFGARSKYHGYH